MEKITDINVINHVFVQWIASKNLLDTWLNCCNMYLEDHTPLEHTKLFRFYDAPLYYVFWGGRHDKYNPLNVNWAKLHTEWCDLIRGMVDEGKISDKYDESY